LGHSSSSVGGAPFSEADRLFSFADLCIGKRKLSVLGALSEAGGSSFSLGQLAPGSKDLSTMRITLLTGTIFNASLPSMKNSAVEFNRTK